jgi:hypothetical protein
MTPEKAAKSVQRARERLNRETSTCHERYRRSLYRIQSQCEHSWAQCVSEYKSGTYWQCLSCKVVSDKNPIRPTRQEGKA